MSSRKKSRVLIVDDEADLRELLLDALERDDLVLEAAASGQEAVKCARKNPPDLLITDLMLGDCTGLDVIDSLRSTISVDLPAIVITGQGDPETLTEASRLRPVELMTKPLDLNRLMSVVDAELGRQQTYARGKARSRKLRRLARDINIQRKVIKGQLETECADLAVAYRALSSQFSTQQVLMGFQRELIGASTDDDVFRVLFRLMVHRSGPVFGVAMVCDAEAELQIAGRFGVPHPDELAFCSPLVEPIVEKILEFPECFLADASDEPENFDAEIRKFLPGVSILAMPLIPAPGELIGLIVFYRKGEQPFCEADIALAEMVATPTAIAIRRND